MTKRTIRKWFIWCLDQAYQMQGAHTGGPYEEQFDRNLKQSEKALKEFQKPKRKT